MPEPMLLLPEVVQAALRAHQHHRCLVQVGAASHGEECRRPWQGKVIQHYLGTFEHDD